MLWLIEIWELGLDTGHWGKNYLWPVSRSIQGGVAGLLKWEMQSDMVPTDLQNRFQLNIRFRFGILVCDPDWTNFLG